MSDTKSNEEKLKELQAQTSILNAQILLNNLRKNERIIEEKSVIDKIKEFEASQSALAKVQGAAPFAELLGIKDASSGLGLSGKEGTISVTKAIDGALLLRLKKELLNSLDCVAKHIVDNLPHDSTFVLLSKEDVEKALRSDLISSQITKQIENIKAARESASLPGQIAGILSVASAGIQTLPFVLDMLSDAAKFFRVDKAYSIFDSNEEGKRLLELFLELHAHKVKSDFLTRASAWTNDLSKEALELLESVNELKKINDLALGQLIEIQQFQEGVAKIPPDQAIPPSPSPAAVAILKNEVTNAKTILDSMNPTVDSSLFWPHVAGRAISKRVKGRNRVEISVICQVVQIQEKRVWRADKLLGAADLQVDFRVTDADGQYITSGIMLYSSGTRSVTKTEQVETTFYPFI